MADTPDNRDFTTKFYDEVNKVIGGTNPNEKLTLMLPGIALTKKDFEYDYKNNEQKGPVIEANESRLANKLYDLVELLGADNGKTLEHQYKSALDMLTPKVNPILANAKNQLRDLLMKPFPYKFGPKNLKKAELWDGEKLTTPNTETNNVPPSNDDPKSEEYSFQEVFFRLYNDYIEQLGEWANERQHRKEYYQKKAEEQKFSDIAQKNKWLENQYLQWYEDNAESWITAVDQKMSILLSVFSDNDMKIIEGVLDSGSGAELQEARQILRDSRKINPDGGYIYPVKFNPTSWFDYLDTSFTPVDLVNSPTAILDELKILYGQRDYFNIKIEELQAKVPSSDTLNTLKGNVEAAKKEYNKCDEALKSAVTSSFTDFAKFAVTTICTACCPPAKIAEEVIQGGITAGQVLEKVNKTEKESGKSSLKDITGIDTNNQVTAAIDDLTASQKDKTNKQKFEDTLGSQGNAAIQALKADLDIGDTINEGIDIFIEGTNRVNLAQFAYLKSMDDYTEAVLREIEGQTQYDSLTNLISSMRMEKQANDSKIKILEEKLSTVTGEDINKCFSADVNPPAVPEGFTQLIINHSCSSSQSSQLTTSSSSTSSVDVGAWIFRSTTHSSSSSSYTQNFCKADKSQIQIGMNVAKVSIEREWFNPGIFALTEEMYSVAENNVKIAEYMDKIDSSGKLKKRVPTGKGVFPSFPTAFVVARDVTIRLSSTSQFDEATASEISSECSSSRTFFVFNSGDSSHSHTSFGQTESKSDQYAVTVRFTTPQIIGFYQQIVPEDMSAPYPSDDSSTEPDKTVEDSIVKFIKAYEKVIEERLPKTENVPKDLAEVQTQQ